MVGIGRISLAFLLVATGAALGVPPTYPSDAVNFQGVLRDAADNPIDGDREMVLRFFDDADPASPENEILVDEHTFERGGGVRVTGGLFNVLLGMGWVRDGAGPGTYQALWEVFRDFSNVFLSVTVNGETMAPRIRIASAASAHNAGTLSGYAPWFFLNTSDSYQQRAGSLGIEVGPGHFSRLAYTEMTQPWPNPVYEKYGIWAAATDFGGRFGNTAAGVHGAAYLATPYYGIETQGDRAGGFFTLPGGSATANVAYQSANGAIGVHATGQYMGGFFADGTGTGEAWVGYANQGVHAIGDVTGGFFEDRQGTSSAWVAHGDVGIEAVGDTSGAYFYNDDRTAEAWVGHDATGGAYGIKTQGSKGGGWFVGPPGTDPDQTTNRAFLAWRSEEGEEGKNFGVYAEGDVGVYAGRNGARAVLAGEYGTGELTGIQAFGNDLGGYFEDLTQSAFARVADVNVGIKAYGNDMGGHFVDRDDGTWSRVGIATYKVKGNGTSTAFVQNHPFEKDKVIVYSAPEGDEIGVYTRGTARLVGGEARVRLGPTFQWVTNPDIGLTVNLTSVGTWSDLYVASKGTEEIVVKSSGGDPEAVFDYLVHGLRIGFEESSVVQEKDIESYIPSMTNHRELYARRPELRSFNALERYKDMQQAAGLSAPGLARASALAAAVHEYDPATDPPACELLGLGPCPITDTVQKAGKSTGGSPEGAQEVADTPKARVPESADSHRGSAPAKGATEAGTEAASGGREVVYARSFRASVAEIAGSARAGEPLDPGDVAVFDSVVPGQLRRGSVANDPAVAGCIVGDAGVLLGSSGAGVGGTAALATSGIVTCKADAAYGAIRVGDLLTVSPTPGHAMRAGTGAPGTILGKAVEPLEQGTGLIKVLVMLR